MNRAIAGGAQTLNPGRQQLLAQVQTHPCLNSCLGLLKNPEVLKHERCLGENRDGVRAELAPKRRR